MPPLPQEDGEDRRAFAGLSAGNTEATSRRRHIPSRNPGSPSQAKENQWLGCVPEPDPARTRRQSSARLLCAIK